MLTDAQARLLLQANPAIVTTLRRDGSPNSTLTWVDWDGEFVIVNTVVGRAKEKNLRNDDRISVCVIDRENPNLYVGVEGRAELTVEGAHEHVNGLAQRYLGTDFGYREGAERIIARFRPTRVWGVPDDAAWSGTRTGGHWAHADTKQ